MLTSLTRLYNDLLPYIKISNNATQATIGLLNLNEKQTSKNVLFILFVTSGTTISFFRGSLGILTFMSRTKVQVCCVLSFFVCVVGGGGGGGGWRLCSITYDSLVISRKLCCADQTTVY